MSLRRKSCDACFKGRRKCDRGYPTCGTCRRTKKSCHYAYAPISSPSPPEDSMCTDTVTAEGFPTHADVSLLGFDGEQFDLLSDQRRPASDSASRTARSSLTSLQRNSTASLSLLPFSDASPTLPRMNIPNFLGDLGEVQRVEGSTDSWRWIIDELRRCPWEFATRGETLFLHKNLYGDTMPRAIRAALGTSAAFCTLQEDRRQLLFRALDAEVLELLRDPPLIDADDGREQGGLEGVNASSNSRSSSSGLTIIDELARLQALTLYQMIRIFGGGLEQRLIVEQQRNLLETWALQLLIRSKAELGSDRARASDADRHVDCWHSWIVAESIRRTVMAVFMLYGQYSLATQGFCSEIPTLSKLPVSAAPASWHSEAAYLAQSRSGEAQKTLTYEEFTQSWMVSRPERIDPFDKFLIVPCKGLEGLASLRDM